ncbi:MAG: zinc transporter ZntB [Phycisphaeraceae bacterium]
METTQPYTPFDAEGGLILATRLPGEPNDFDTHRRTWTELTPPEAEPPLWVHLDRTRDRAQQWLRQEAGLDPIVAESLLAEETRPRAQVIGQGLLVILRGINANPGAEPDELIAIRMWLEANRIITLRQYRFRTIADLRARAQRGAAPVTAGAFLTAVATGLVSHMTPSINNLEERLDEIEEEMLTQEIDPPIRRSQLATIRRQAIAYRRFLVPQRDALASLVNGSPPLLSPRDQVELRVAMEQAARVTEALEELRDRAAVTQEEMRARHDARSGRTLYLLTLVATVALPLGLITGLLGVNVGGIPLASSTWGFAITCLALVAIAIGQVLWFKKMKWI